MYNLGCQGINKMAYTYYGVFNVSADICEWTPLYFHFDATVYTMSCMDFKQVSVYNELAIRLSLAEQSDRKCNYTV